MMRVAVLAPVATSPYSRLVAHLVSQAEGLEVVSVVIKTPWSLTRILSEMRREGGRLVLKVCEKMVLRDRAGAKGQESIGRQIERYGLRGMTLRRWARDRGIPCRTVRDLNDPDTLEFLRRAEPDVVAFTGGGLIRRALLAVPTKGVLNVHAGILPQYRGSCSLEWPALERTLDTTGIGATLHFMDRGVDTGDILLQERLALRPEDSFESIRTRLELVQVDLMMRGLVGLADGLIARQPQENEDGRQYFVMHPRLREAAERVLRKYLATLG